MTTVPNIRLKFFPALPIRAAVRYDVAQTLTSDEQAQARDNIGVAAGSQLIEAAFPVIQMRISDPASFGEVTFSDESANAKWVIGQGGDTANGLENTLYAFQYTDANDDSSEIFGWKLDNDGDFRVENRFATKKGTEL